MKRCTGLIATAASARDGGCARGTRLLERLLRALDRLNCAQAILDAQRKRLLGTNCNDEVWERMNEAVRVLVGNRPKDYPDGTVEWLPVKDGGRRPGY